MSSRSAGPRFPKWLPIAGLLLGLAVAGANAQDATVTGRVVDEFQRPVVGATIEVLRVQITATTDESGRFRLRIPAGTYDVIARFPGYSWFGRDIVVSAGQFLEVNIRLRPVLMTVPPPPPPPTPVPPPPDGLPQFPWPPPNWTSRHVVPAGLAITSADQSLGQVEARLKAALSRAGISEWSVYGIKDDGFAMATRIESIEKDGTPKQGNARWSVADPALAALQEQRSFSLWEYLRSLFTAQRGRYRVIVITVTNRPVTPGGEGPLPPPGAAQLPLAWQLKSLMPGTVCTALVYEFYRPSAEDDAVLLGMSPVLAKQHLIRAGLWSDAELSR